jgi:hypothetical protein
VNWYQPPESKNVLRQSRKARGQGLLKGQSGNKIAVGVRDTGDGMRFPQHGRLRRALFPRIDCFVRRRCRDENKRTCTGRISDVSRSSSEQNQEERKARSVASPYLAYGDCQLASTMLRQCKKAPYITPVPSRYGSTSEVGMLAETSRCIVQ